VVVDTESCQPFFFFALSLSKTRPHKKTPAKTVEDEAFWEGSAPVVFGPLPQLQEAVTVVGYPIGGDTISVTSGVVSRIEVGVWLCVVVRVCGRACV
jgi:hypothetical protein